jgi:TetR/AcrR family transcriptional regulator
MSLFGMLNWAFFWFRENGPMTRRDYAELAARMVVLGARDLAGMPPIATSRTARAATNRARVQTAS